MGFFSIGKKTIGPEKFPSQVYRHIFHKYDDLSPKKLMRNTFC